ncbi:MAG: alpha/beta fold hydrolase [Anaerolineae bacterium]
MTLELLTHPPQNDNPKQTPLLFVHGAWHGAWCWDEYWLPYFARRGYPCYALSLRGHGNSPQPRPMWQHSINDYVADVESITTQIEREHVRHPVIIGHSMGGFITQKYLEKHQAPAGVLLASIPAHGALPFFTRNNLKHPLVAMKALFTFRLDHFVNTPALTREEFFSADVPESDIERYAARMDNESWRMALDVMGFNLPRPDQVKTPLLVLGGEKDAVFHVWETERTARAYKTQAVIMPNAAHDMMLDTRWQAAADYVLGWLAERGL